MNNFFLLDAALNPATISDFETGVVSLMEAVANRNAKTDFLIRHDGFWDQHSIHGYFYEIPYKLNKELIGLSIKLFYSFTPIPTNILNEIEFDGLYGNDCNGFKGFNFAPTAIPLNRQITNLDTLKKFKLNCAMQNAYKSVKDFWDNREILFPHLIFCDRIWFQIRHLSINDDRFKLINEKLKRLNAFTDNWKNGIFEYKNLGLDNSPDTPKRIADTLALRTFECPAIGNKVFSLHIKWSFGREFFRLYYFPNDGNNKVYIGYIGPKDDIGF